MQFLSNSHVDRFFSLAFVFVLGLCLSPRLQAQDLGDGTERCGAAVLLKEQLERQNISMEQYFAQIKEKMEANRSDSNSRQAQGTTYTLPIVVHIIYYANRPIESGSGNLTDCHVHTAIAELNKVYAQTHGFDIPSVFSSVAAGDMGIRFELATRDPEGNPTTGILRHPIEGGLLTAVLQFDPRRLTNSSISSIHNAVGPWDTSKYLNLYVYPFSLGGQLLGIGSFPTGNSNNNNGGNDFVVVNNIAFSPIPPHSRFNTLSRVLAHEVGHYLNLYHIWGDVQNGECGARGRDDQCADTPETNSLSQACGDNYICDPNGPRAMTENYMDYSPDVCMKLFTVCQRRRALAALTTLRTDLYDAENSALEGEPPSINMAIYRDYTRTRPESLFFDSDSFRFRIPTLYVTNEGQTPVGSATIGFDINGEEIARVRATTNFDFCNVKFLGIPQEVHDLISNTPLSIENTLTIWVNAEGEGDRTNDTIFIRASGPAGIAEEVAEDSSPIKLFPNPSNGELSLVIEVEKRQEAHVSFFDTSGNLGYSEVFEVTPNNNRIAFSPTVPGGAMYFVHVKTENLDEVKRLIMR